MIVRAWLVGAVAALGAMSSGAQAPVKYTEIYSSDSLELLAPALSPNGKWVVFVARPQNQSGKGHLMIIPAAGGEPRQLTAAGQNDKIPIWFPSGDRIVFHTSRVNDGLMTLRIDTVSGAAIGAPQRLTLEPTQPTAFATSLDGKEVAYGAVAKDGKIAIRVIPATGGAARVVAEINATVMPQLFWPTADSLVLSAVEGPGTGFQRPFVVMELGIRGGKPRVIGRYAPNGTGFRHLTPTLLMQGAVLKMMADTMGTLRVTSLYGGDTIARVDMRGTHNHSGLNLHIRPTFQPNVLMLATNGTRSITRLLSVDGGSPRTIFPTTAEDQSDYPEGFSADSKYLYGRSGSKTYVAVAPIRNGAGQTRRIPLPAGHSGSTPTPSGKYLYVQTGHHRDSLHALQILDIATGRTDLITAAYVDVGSAAHKADDDFFYGERKGDQIEIRRWRPGQGSTLLHTVPAGGFFTTGFDAHAQIAVAPGGRASAYAQVTRDSVRLFVQTGTGAPRLIHAVAGRTIRWSVAWSQTGRMLGLNARVPAGRDTVAVIFVATFDDQMRQIGPVREALRLTGKANTFTPNWSHDGKTIAVPVEYPNNDGTPVSMVFVSVDEDNGSVGLVKRVQLPSAVREWNDIAYWLADDDHVLVPTSNGDQTTHIWKVSRKGNEPPVNIAAEERWPFWEFIMSPDHRLVSYEVELPEHTSIIRVDLPIGTPQPIPPTIKRR